MNKTSYFIQCGNMAFKGEQRELPRKKNTNDLMYNRNDVRKNVGNLQHKRKRKGDPDYDFVGMSAGRIWKHVIEKKSAIVSQG